MSEAQEKLFGGWFGGRPKLMLAPGPGIQIGLNGLNLNGPEWSWNGHELELDNNIGFYRNRFFNQTCLSAFLHVEAYYGYSIIRMQKFSLIDPSKK